MTDELMTVAGHINEARKRIIICLFFWGFSFIFIYLISPGLLKQVVLAGQAFGVRISMLTPVEIFLCETGLAGWLALIVSFPVFLFQIKAYFKLPISRINLICAYISFIAGAALGLRILLPAALKLFIIMAVKMGLGAEFTVDKATAFVLSFAFVGGLLLSGFYLIFEIIRKGKISVYCLRKIRPAIYAAIFVLSAVITPPDVISMLLAAIPMAALYEISMMCALIKKKT